VARLGPPGGSSATGKKELWERWRAGESISDIARALRKPPGSIHGMLEATGGLSPPQRRRRRCALTSAEREEISRGLATGESLRAIAARLGRSASTVCREVNRNGGRRRYRAAEAEEQALKRSRRPKRCLLAMNERLRDIMVAHKLREDCSPTADLRSAEKDGVLTRRRCACHTRASSAPCSCRPEARPEKGTPRPS
jgi:Helix-turn-helix domain